jgi:hypothetical protein
MPEENRILTLERDGDDGMIVTFSDGTTAAYVVEELIELRPHREPSVKIVPTRLALTLEDPRSDDLLDANAVI